MVVNGIEYEVQDGEYEGGTDLKAETFNTMQQNIENSIFDTLFEKVDEWEE